MSRRPDLTSSRVCACVWVCVCGGGGMFVGEWVLFVSLIGWVFFFFFFCEGLWLLLLCLFV